MIHFIIKGIGGGVSRVKNTMILKVDIPKEGPGFGYFEWRDSGFGQNLGRDSGFATSGGSGIKSFFMAGNGISRHRRDRDLDYFAIFWRDSKYYPFHPSIWLF